VSHTPFANPQHQQGWGVGGSSRLLVSLRAFAHAQHQQGRSNTNKGGGLTKVPVI